MASNEGNAPPSFEVDFTVWEYQYLSKDAFVISTGVFTAVTILANLFLMIVILLSSKLRSSSQHIIIFALCLTDLFAGAFEYPLLTQFLHLERWVHNCVIRDIVDIDLFFILTSIKSLLVISISADFVVRVLFHGKMVRNVVAFLMIGVSVGLSIAVLLPLRFAVYGPHCGIFISGLGSNTLNILCIMPQAAGIICMIGLISSMQCCNPKRYESSRQPRSGPWDIILAGLIVVICYLPVHIMNITSQRCYGSLYCKEYFITRGVLGRIYYLPSCLLPFVWLLNSLTREGIKHMCCCRRNVRDSDPTVMIQVTKGIESTRM